MKKSVMCKNNKNIILGLTGSVATIKAPELVTEIKKTGHELKIVATGPSFYFLPEDNSWTEKIYTDGDEWPNKNYTRDDDVMHIDFRKWADVLLIAPLTANTLAKIANGMCDNFITCIARAWDKEKPFLIAPAMNTEMWEDPITQEHIDLINKRFNLTVIDPVEKTLACGDTGMGAMASIKTIVSKL